MQFKCSLPVNIHYISVSLYPDNKYLVSKMFYNFIHLASKYEYHKNMKNSLVTFPIVFGCRVNSNRRLVVYRSMLYMGIFLRDPSQYFREILRGKRKNPIDQVDKLNRELKPAPPFYQFDCRTTPSLVGSVFQGMCYLFFLVA